MDVPSKGMVIVRNDCLGSEWGVLEMNVIQHCWGEVMRGAQPGALIFVASQQGKARREWERVFAVWYQLQNRPPVPKQLGNTHLTRRDPVQIPAHSEVVCWAQVSGGGLAEGQCGLVDGMEDGGEWKVAWGLVRVQRGQVLLQIANVHPFPIELYRRGPLATIAGIDPSQVQGDHDMVLQTPSPGEVDIDIRTTQAPAGAGSPLDLPKAEGLTPDQQQRFQELIRRWAGVFAAHKEDFGKTDAVLHNIPTGDAPPSHKSLFPELRSLMREMLENRVIAESASLRASPVVLVRKKDGAWHFCVD
ncbi:hypothetical protein SKAU_G00063340 [Synaphobranchus kaupii]|uniref:Uncharacterized protein n=1 Tax=Synaphobranchus kaupii TaxID=118154 RepID=A0A9Q1G5B1_SYNKA|nr:hypothetical protein SKAU_G00063340 [Synaphobranchus kaupii]